MKWSDFVLAVNEHLSVDAVRRGTEVMRARAMKNAVIDLQRMIVQYRTGHTTLYREANLSAFGESHVGSFPPFARPSAFYIYSNPKTASAAASSGDFSGADFSADDFGTGTGSGSGTSSSGGTPADFNPADFNPADFPVSSGAPADFDPADFNPTDFPVVGGTPSTPGDFAASDFSAGDFKVGGTITPPTPGTISTVNPLQMRNRLDFHPWKDRQSMINGCLAPRAYRYSISPEARKFLVYPQISETRRTYLLLVWDGIKESFAGDDTVRWPEAAAEAVAFFVKAVIQRNVDKNLPLARETESDYQALRRALYREANEALDAEKDDEENISSTDVIAPPAP